MAIPGQSTQSDHIFQNSNKKEATLIKHNNYPGSLYKTWYLKYNLDIQLLKLKYPDFK